MPRREEPARQPDLDAIVGRRRDAFEEVGPARLILWR